MPDCQTPVFLAQNLLAQTPAAGFDCGDCTACCTVLAVTELQKPMRFACQQICRDGCRIYSDRPAGCRQFNCLWLRGALRAPSQTQSHPDLMPGPEDPLLRPDHLGVIWDYFIEGTSGIPCLVAFEVWTNAFQRTDVMESLVEICETMPLRLSFRDGEWANASCRDELEAVFKSR